jgi:uncharacterized integral membrane protein
MIRGSKMNETLQSMDGDSHTESRHRVSGRTYFKLFSTLLCAILFVVLAVQNAEAVRVSLFFWNVELSMTLVIFFSVLVGAAVSASVYGRVVWNRSRGHRE